MKSLDKCPISLNNLKSCLIHHYLFPKSIEYITSR
jgi:hypothetical protein